MNEDTELGAGPRSFPSTHASFVAGLAAAAAGARARAAETLARSYWRPIYKYVRLRSGKSNEDAKDLTQAFLTWLLATDALARFEPARGRLRSFLRLLLDGFVANEEKAQARLKRGGDRAFLALDFEGADAELAGLAPSAPGDLEAWFEAEWRRTFVAGVLAELERSLASSGHGLRAALFRRYDLCDDPAARPSYAELAREHGLAEHAVTNHLAAARRTFRELLLARLRAETADEREFQAELAALLGGRA
jgi:RNA polymerase sigma-70 factor (ECF subfamily)